MNKFTKVAPGHFVKTQNLRFLGSTPCLLSVVTVNSFDCNVEEESDWEFANEMHMSTIMQCSIKVRTGTSVLKLYYETIKTDIVIYEETALSDTSDSESLKINGKWSNCPYMLDFVRKVVNISCKRDLPFKAGMLTPVSGVAA